VNEVQLAALWGMFMLGLFPLLPYIVHGHEMPRFWRIAIPVWSFFWLAPPLLSLWVRGVFG
jgi:hypothetical protein